MKDNANSKSELRKIIREMKHEHSQSYLDECSTSICTHVIQHELIGKARIVFAYYSLEDEVNTHKLINQLLEMGKKVVLPKVVGDGIMELREYASEADLKKGAFNIMEPTGNCFTAYNKIDVAIVPGMAFDRKGNRLGRGKGYYDRLLPQLINCYKIGICFPFQLVDRVPTNDFDIKMNEVITAEIRQGCRNLQ
ncbi:MAG: 5-formyltetrahydrofolate cyclo-ligase [Prevotella sp.]|jgi:5-formyltetrahydrofolate cyclo-ligase